MARKNETKGGVYQIVKNEHGTLQAFHGKYRVCGFSHLSVRTYKRALEFMQIVEDEFGTPDPKNIEQLKAIRARLRELGPRGEIGFN